MKLSDVPVVMFENELTGEKHAVWKVSSNLLCQICELFNRVDAEPDVTLCGKITVVAVCDKIIQCFL